MTTTSRKTTSCQASCHRQRPSVSTPERTKGASFLWGPFLSSPEPRSVPGKTQPPKPRCEHHQHPGEGRSQRHVAPQGAVPTALDLEPDFSASILVQGLGRRTCPRAHGPAAAHLQHQRGALGFSEEPRHLEPT